MLLENFHSYGMLAVNLQQILKMLETCFTSKICITISRKIIYINFANINETPKLIILMLSKFNVIIFFYGKLIKL